MKNKNILIISLHADPSDPSGTSKGGGTHAYLRELIQEMAATQNNCMVITRSTGKDKPTVQRISDYGKICRIVIGKKGYMDKRLLDSFHNETIKTIQETLIKEKFNPDLLHSIYWNSGRAAYTLSGQMNIPYVHTVISNGKRRLRQGLSDNAKNRLEIEQLVFENAFAIFSITEQEKNDIIQFYAIPANKIFIVGRPVASSFMNPSQNAIGEPRIELKTINGTETIPHSNNDLKKALGSPAVRHRFFVYVGRIDPYKGLPEIIQAWWNLKQIYKLSCPGLWIIGGHYKDIQYFRKRANLPKDLHVLEAQRDIVWWGYLDSSGVSAVLLKALALVTHSIYEPGGRVILEAMSQGVPVIATPFGFAHDLIGDWDSGFLVDYGDIKTMQRRLDHFIQQPYLGTALGYNAKKRALSALKNWDFKGKHINTYSNALSRKSSLQNGSSAIFHQRSNVLLRKIILPDHTRLSSKSINKCIIKMHERLAGSTPDKVIPLDTLSGTDTFWKTSSGDVGYLFKHYHSNFRETPMWLRTRQEAFIHFADDKFENEEFASHLPGFIRILDSDSKRLLIAKPWMEEVRYGTSVSDCAQILMGPLKKLWEYNPEYLSPEDQTLLEIEGSESHNDNFYHTFRTLRNRFAYPIGNSSYETNMISIRLWIPFMKNQILIGSVLLENNINNDFFSILPILENWTLKEKDMPIVFTHGNTDKLNFYFSHNGGTFISGGETLHRCLWGKDAGNTLRKLLKMFPKYPISDLISLVEQDTTRQRLVLAWAMLLELNCLARNNTLLFHDEYRIALQHWPILVEAICEMK